MSSNVKPISEARSAAARANGAKSQGPKTPEGKARSARNSLRHGLTAETLVLPHESAQDFEQLHADFLARFEPRDAAELALVEQMVSATWRQRRYWQVETNLLGMEIVDNRQRVEKQWKGISEEDHCALAFKSLGHSTALDRLLRYDNSLRRQFERALTLLLKLRAEEEKTAKRTQAKPAASLETTQAQERAAPAALAECTIMAKRTQDSPHPPAVPVAQPSTPQPPLPKIPIGGD